MTATSTTTASNRKSAVPAVSLEKSATFVSLVKKEVPVIPVSVSVAAPSATSTVTVVAPKRRGRPIGSVGARKVSEVSLSSTQVLSERAGIFLLAVDRDGRQVRVRLGSVSAMTQIAASLQREAALLNLF